MVIDLAAGRLIHEIVIEKLTGNSQSATGSTSPAWTPFMPVYAEVKPLHGRNIEIALARTKGKSVSHQVSLRYPGFGIEPVTYRINFHGRIFEIFSVVDVYELNITLEILCNESVS